MEFCSAGWKDVNGTQSDVAGQPSPVALTYKGENPTYLKGHWTNNQITLWVVQP